MRLFFLLCWRGLRNDFRTMDWENIVYDMNNYLKTADKLLSIK